MNETLTVGEQPLPFLRYDGKMGSYYQFTEYDKSVASFGCSFYLKTTDTEAVSRRREEKRIEFEGAK